MEIGDGVTMTFTEDDKLVYVIYQKDSKQIMNLVFKVDGNQLVTNQPSHPGEEKTRFSFDAEGNLILEYDGNKSWYTPCIAGAAQQGNQRDISLGSSLLENRNLLTLQWLRIMEL